ncbi:protein FAM114A2 isoform X2 [Hyposmocoma kahamanoa]|uniref:protein FAM114A2 isoform X2 n=1 Tax=Hyposmocoma kahamanoa TaxID=1477025 RepID=UPI000E6D7A55|nr:protein FAM114A2 isoform X2 [Hyposmocoma kahamanoa]
MEVLQDGDPGLERKKRAMMGFFDPDKPILSQVLREAKSKADEEDRIKEEKREAKEVHYENLFDDFEGLVHLEALEMLSKQVSMRIEERVQSASPKHRQDIKETLQQVAELCEMPDEEDEEETMDSDQPKPEAFLERLQRATKDLGVKLQFQPLVKQYTEILEYMDDDSNDFTDKTMYKKAIGSLAQATALSVEIYHKAAEMLLVKPRRSTADEADGLTQLTVVLTKHTSDVATVFTQEMDKRATYENAIECKNYITNIFLEAGNSATYIQNAFQLTLKI